MRRQPATYNEVVGRFGDRDELALAELVATALFNQALLLDFDELALPLYSEIVTRFGDRTELALTKRVACALVNKASILYNTGQFDETEDPSGVVTRIPKAAYWQEATSTCDEVLARFGGRTELPLVEAVAGALDIKAAALMCLDRTEEQLAIYEQIVARFGDRDEPELAGWVAKALFNKAGTLGDLGRFDAAVAACDDLVARFADRSEREIAEPVGMALEYKAVLLDCLGLSDRRSMAAYLQAMDEIGDRLAPLAEDVGLWRSPDWPRGYFHESKMR